MSFIEPSYSTLPDDSFTFHFQNEPAEEGKIVINENDWPVGMASRSGSAWTAASFMYRKPNIEVIELMDDIDAEIIRSGSEPWAEAVREHFSLRLMAGTTPAIEDHSSDRMAKVKDLVHEVWPKAKGETCLDCGCGSGMGSSALRSLGIVPLAYDNDPALVCLGLTKGRLEKENTILIDATYASTYIRPCHYGMALMAGTIVDQTGPMWREILVQMMTLTDESLVTVETEKEVNMVRSWAKSELLNTKVFENERDPFYDRWVCLIK